MSSQTVPRDAGDAPEHFTPEECLAEIAAQAAQEEEADLAAVYYENKLDVYNAKLDKHQHLLEVAVETRITCRNNVIKLQQALALFEAEEKKAVDFWVCGCGYNGNWAALTSCRVCAEARWLPGRVLSIEESIQQVAQEDEEEEDLLGDFCLLCGSWFQGPNSSFCTPCTGIASVLPPPAPLVACPAPAPLVACPAPAPLVAPPVPPPVPAPVARRAGRPKGSKNKRKADVSVEELEESGERVVEGFNEGVVTRADAHLLRKRERELDEWGGF